VANTKSAEKAARQAEKHRAHNVALRSKMRSAVRGALESIGGSDKKAATASFRSASSAVDGLVSKGLVHRNKASRHKSRLAARLKAMK
jgi:small subunit ribosomal protein S20